MEANNRLLAALVVVTLMLTCVLVEAEGNPQTAAQTVPDSKAQLDSLDQAAVAKMAQALAKENSKPKLAVMDALVTVDGLPRPDLGAAFSDALTAKLLTAGSYDVVDASSLGGASTGGAVAAYDFGKSTGADFVVVPTIIGIQGEFRLSMRKLRLPGGRIDKIIQETVRGDQRLIFGLAEKTATQLAPAPQPNPNKKPEVGYSYVRTWLAPTPKPDPIANAVKTAPKALRSSVSKVKFVGSGATDAKPQRLGEISVVDQQWCFCEIPTQATGLQLHDAVFAWSGSETDLPISLKISRLASGRIVAEFDSADPLKNTLRTGLSVYQWKLPNAK